MIEPPMNSVALNDASADKLASVLGVDSRVGEELVEYRERVGGFDSCEQLLSVPASAAVVPGVKRNPLLDPGATRPILPRFIVRQPEAVFKQFWAGIGLFVLFSLLLPPWLRSRGIGGDPFLLPLAFLLSGLGVAMLFSVKDPLRDHAVAQHHILGILFSMIVMAAVAGMPPTARLRIRHYQYVWVIAALILVVALVVFGNGPEGVKLNLLHFQPVELIKLFLVFFLASALAERADLIADFTSKPGAPGVKPTRASAIINSLLPRKQDFGPMSVMFACSLLLFYVLKDMGPGLLLFATFIAMIYILTGRTRFLFAGIILIALGGVLGYWRHIGVFATRVDMWLNPFANTHPNGMQLGQSIWGMATGGWHGSGLGLGMPGSIPRSGSDMAFSSWAEETGIIGSFLLLIVFVALVWRGIRVALEASNALDRALATGLTALLAFQTLLILAGVTGMFPLSGIALPFFSYGNSALVAAYALIGMLRGISSTSARQKVPHEPRIEVVRAGRTFGFAFTFVMLCMIGAWRLGELQAARADMYAIRTIQTPDADHISRPHINPRLLAMAAQIDRGSIYDRNNAVLATSREPELRAYFADHRTAARMAAYHQRYYPFGAATANLVGYLDGAVGGPFGLERTYNSELRGFARYADLLADYHRKNSFGFRQRRGLDLHLTVDARLQRTAQAILARTAAKQKDSDTGRTKDRGGFVLMDPPTGDIIVAATTPTFDPNTLTPEKIRSYNTGDDAKFEHRFVDRSRFGFYPPGSTMKVATAACALDNMPNAINFMVTSNHVADTIRWQANGKWYVRKHVREDEADPSFGALTMGSALRVSSNIYFANLAATLGSDTLRQTLVNKFCYSHVPSQANFDADLPDIGYGQGRMLASPLEMCRLAACVANDGRIPTPRLVTALTMPGDVEKSDLPDDPTDRPRTFDSVPPATAITLSSAKTLQDFMRVVVTSGTARNIFTNMPFTVAGKTGSAQNHQYDKKAHSWFIGFAPCSDQAPARYAFACCVENSGYGRAAAAPICRDVLRLVK
jgi:cell division protein FtsI/penicillin-binding protein 2/cell division protein FtsW (lipid II flippase)